MRWKQWPLDRYRELIEGLLKQKPDSRIVLFGSPGELGMIEELAGGLGQRVLVAAGRTTVKEVAALIELCDLLVCNDSGLMHVAVAMGTPVVAIYGPTDIRRTAPLGERNTVIRHDIACSPCFRLEGDAQVDGADVPEKHLVVFDRGSRPVLRAKTPVKCLLMGGEPLDAPRHMWWNFVSSSQERIDQAKQDWREGRFGQVPGETEFIPLPER